MFDAAVTQFAEVEDVSEIGGDNVTARAFDLGLRYMFLDPTHKLRPYLGGGMTYFQTNATNISIDSGAGVYGLVGLRFGKTPGIQFMADLVYRWAEVEAKPSLPETIDVTVGGLALQAGISFVF
jgi:outer membrane protein W